ncbi:PLP-dependent aminotransferase family protein [Seleniivibrio sp.]|uniref:aminotransferase-like domain-containing protein n=1 Tax=Seleniivibrio sp. TaxID=2898801 RepID=UPI0025FE3CBB|nr:PLP-dependent aminotransferase family protein [Seleniivibrio sp.]MCD8553594.1 PLP-dependent aminotransferase family protein [Seleniivibrio sp.]
MFSNWNPDRGSETPLYMQLASYLRSEIIDGRILPETKLPSLSVMQNVFAVSRNTCINALEQISSEGLIEISPKKKPVVIYTTNNLPSSSSPDWFRYIKHGKHFPTDEHYHRLSYLRGQAGLINTYEMRLGKEFHPEVPVNEALAKVSKKISGLYHHSFFDVKGIPMVRELVCSAVREYGIEADPSQVLLTSGPMNAMTLICKGLLSIGTNVFTVSPNSLKPMNFFNTFGLNVINVNQDSGGINIEDLKSKTHKARGGILHVNPVAFWPNMLTMSDQRIKDVFSLCSAKKLPVMENDMMREYWLVKEPPVPLKAYDKSGVCIYIYSFTRPLIPGLRMAAIIAPSQVINQLADVKLQSEWGTDTISQLTFGELISENLFKNYMGSIRPALLERRDEVDLLMQRYLGDIATWKKEDCGLNFWIRFNSDIDTSSLACEKEGILIYSGALAGNSYRNCLWLCYSCISITEMETVLMVISRLAKSAISKMKTD